MSRKRNVHKKIQVNWKTILKSDIIINSLRSLDTITEHKALP